MALGIALMAHLSRALRWNILLGTLGHKPKARNTFIAVMSGYFGNIFIPRGGELMRCAILNRSDKIPFESSFATVVAERVFDFLCLLFLMVISLVLEFDRFYKLFKDIIFAPKPKQETSVLMWVIYGLFILGAVAFLVFRKKIIASSFYAKAKNFVITTINQAKDVFLTLNNKGLFIFHTVFIWVCYYFMTYLIFFSLPVTEHLGPMAGFVVLIAGAFGMSAPTIGGIGSFHFMVYSALFLFYGVKMEDGKSYAFVLHSSQLLTMLVIGGFCTFLAYYVIGKKPKEKDSELESK